jgi:hypothetical protein
MSDVGIHRSVLSLVGILGLAKETRLEIARKMENLMPTAWTATAAKRAGRISDLGIYAP